MDMRENGHAYTFDDSVRPTPSAIISPTRPQFLTLCKQRHPLETKCSNAQDYGISDSEHIWLLVPRTFRLPLGSQDSPVLKHVTVHWISTVE